MGYTCHSPSDRGAQLADGPDLGALAATFVLVTAIAGPLADRALDPQAPVR